MRNTIKLDIVIIGGGIAGLWLLNRLRHLGYSVFLLEGNALGGGQTYKAQGIIHGGMKYILQGTLTKAAEYMANLPNRWQECLSGQGEIDLSGVPVLSERQYLWSPRTLGGKLSGFLANIALKSKVQPLDREDFPDIFQHSDFKGQVYALNEMVLDVHALIRELVKPCQEVIFKTGMIQAKQLHFDEEGNLEKIQIDDELFGSLDIQAKKYIFSAGEGNESILSALKNKASAMQRRPLHMVVMKAKFLYPLYAHCLGLSSTPRITITSHVSQDNQVIWYLGGQLAEEGVGRDAASQIAEAKKELKSLFPWIDFSAATWASFLIDRAEGLQPNGSRPDSYVINEIKNMLITWPTKLALVPLLVDDIINRIENAGIMPQPSDMHVLRPWPLPMIAKPVWDELL